MLIEEGDPPTIQPIEAKDLQAGDILYLALPLLAYSVIDNTPKRHLGGRTSRNIVTLVDVTGGVRKYKLLAYPQVPQGNRRKPRFSTVGWHTPRAGHNRGQRRCPDDEDC